jgi:hypothetical protein
MQLRPHSNPRAQAQSCLHEREISGHGQLCSGRGCNCTGQQRDLAGVDRCAHAAIALREPLGASTITFARMGDQQARTAVVQVQ